MKLAENTQTLQVVIGGAVALSLFCYQSRFPRLSKSFPSPTKVIPLTYQSRFPHLPRRDFSCGQPTLPMWPAIAPVLASLFLSSGHP